MSTPVLILTIVGSLASLIAIYAMTEAVFHSRNVTRILEGLPPRRHRFRWRQWICDWTTGGK